MYLVKLVQLNASTGKPQTSTPHVYALAQRLKAPDAIEAGYIIYRKPYYYLFTSFGLCCRGVNSTYHIMVGRSKTVTGAYVDKSGKRLLQGGGTEVLKSQGNMIGPGGQSIYKHGSTYYMVYHYYDAKEAGAARLQIRKLSWTPSGWPTAGKPIVPVP
nr:arabinan endo-1,5-alpha-L-arabinosidase [Alicyclobacillus sp. SO9]